MGKISILSHFLKIQSTKRFFNALLKDVFENGAGRRTFGAWPLENTFFTSKELKGEGQFHNYAFSGLFTAKICEKYFFDQSKAQEIKIEKKS